MPSTYTASPNATPLETLERRRDALAHRLAAVCAEPSPWLCEGVEFTSSLVCSITRGQLTAKLLRNIDAVNDEISALNAAPPARPCRCGCNRLVESRAFHGFASWSCMQRGEER